MRQEREKSGSLSKRFFPLLLLWWIKAAAVCCVLGLESFVPFLFCAINLDPIGNISSELCVLQRIYCHLYLPIFLLRQLSDKIENFPGFLPFMKFDMSCVEKKIFEMCPDVTSITQVFKYATQICAANSTYNLMNGPHTKTPKKTLIFSRKIMLFWKPFSGFCCTLKTANNEPIHFKLAVNHTGDSSIKWPMKVEHFLLHSKK